MSSPGMDSDGPKQPTARQMEILTLIMKNLNSKVDVDVSSYLANQSHIIHSLPKLDLARRRAVPSPADQRKQLTPLCSGKPSPPRLA